MAFFEGIKMTAGYGDGPDIINSCNISANRGEIVAILGPNGAGKSTAMKAMLGLLTLKSGSVCLDGEDISKISPQDRVKKGISFVPQTRNVFADLTVRENLEIGGFLREVGLEEMIKNIYELFPILKEKQSQIVGQLSGGQRQQVALGRALMSEPSVLMLDEPTAGVSPIVMDELFEHIIKVKKTNVAVPNGVVMISPSATSPGLTDLNDNGYFFRTAPSDARGGQVLADITKDRKVKSIAVTHTNNDYGKGLADVYVAAVKAHGINVTAVTAHEEGKGDYGAEVATLAAAGGDALAVLGYLDQAGGMIIQGSLDSGAFDVFVLSDGMIGDSLTDRFGKDLNKSFGSLPGSTGKGAGKFAEVAKAGGIDSSGPYTGESYDAAALIALSMQAGGKADRGTIQANVMDVANAPGTKIYPGELKKALDLLAKGKAVNYEGATGVEFTDVGEAFGSFLEKEIKGGKFKTKKQR